MHWFKQWQRGYNQAQILAQELSKKINCPLKPLLKRRHWTGAQALMSRTQRQENIRHIFEFNTKEKMPKGTILIVDDVLTTGATLTACCKALINSGAKDICILTAARG
jgi:ComF family protein